MKSSALEDEVKELIAMKRAGDYWCFRREYFTNEARLLHAILCMANNRIGRDAYIIFGVDEEKQEIVGVEDEAEGGSSQDIQVVLKKAKFSGHMIPSVDTRTMIIEGHQIDVLIVRNSFDTPYYLMEDFGQDGSFIRAYHIYTRVAGKNTQMSENADPHFIELLWKKRIHFYESRYF